MEKSRLTVRKIIIHLSRLLILHYPLHIFQINLQFIWNVLISLANLFIRRAMWQFKQKKIWVKTSSTLKSFRIKWLIWMGCKTIFYEFLTLLLCLLTLSMTTNSILRMEILIFIKVFVSIFHGIMTLQRMTQSSYPTLF